MKTVKKLVAFMAYCACIFSCAGMEFGDCWYEALSDRYGITMARWDDFYAGCYVAIPVIGYEGTLKASDVKVFAGNFTSFGSPVVKTDAQMWAAYGKPVMDQMKKYPKRFTEEKDDEILDGEFTTYTWSNGDWADDHGGKYYELGCDIWDGDGEIRADRQWILVPTKLPAKSARKGWKSFYVGVRSADEYYPVVFNICEDQVRQRLPALRNLHEVQAFPRPMTGGTVSGSGLFPLKTKVTLKAKPIAANKKKKIVGTVFCGWYADKELTEPMPGAWQASSYALTVKDDSPDSLYAKFLAPTNAAAKRIVASTAESFYVFEPGKTATVPVVVDSGCLYTVKASNLPAGLKLKQKSDKSYYITGKPTTPGEKTVTVKVTNTANTKGVSFKFRILVTNWRDDAHFQATTASETEESVTTYLQDHYDNLIAGVKVVGFTIPEAKGSTATLPKTLGLAFNSKTGAVTGTPKAPGKYLVTFTKKVRTGGTAKKPKYTTYKATTLFVVYQGYGDHSGDGGKISPAIQVSAQLKVPALGIDDSLAGGATNTVMVGLRQSIAVSTLGQSNVANTVKVSGLPAGLVYKSGKISGTPTKAGTYKVKISASNKWKWTGSLSFTLVVEALPSWVRGSFYGAVHCTNVVDRSEWYYGTAALTVGATGKISGKLKLDEGEMVSLSFANFTSVEEGAFICSGATTYKDGKKSCKFDVRIAVAEQGGIVLGLAAQSDATANRVAGFTGGEAHLLKSLWTSTDKTLAAKLKGKSVKATNTVPGCEDYLYTVTATFGASGAVTAKYKAKDAERNKTLSTTWSVSGRAIVTDVSDDGVYTIVVPLVLAKPDEEYAQLTVTVDAAGTILSKRLDVPNDDAY